MTVNEIPGMLMVRQLIVIDEIIMLLRIIDSNTMFTILRKFL
jgi:hypothetical protein